MIAVERTGSPDSLNGRGSSGARERDDAIAFYADPGNAEESFEYKAYKKLDVARALEDMFHRKCAYCENHYGALEPVDIEHYRPKGAVLGTDGEKLKPGYYWLAATWNNLLPSCIDCNRARKHEYEDGRRKTGKADSFPLADETKRARSPGAEADEEPLLLDPTRDDPTQHLEFDEGDVKPTERNGSESERGRASIEVFGLQRPELVRARQDRLRWIELAIATIRREAARLAEDPDDRVAAESFEEQLSALRIQMSPESPFAAMARQRIVPVLEELEAGVIERTVPPCSVR